MSYIKILNKGTEFEDKYFYKDKECTIYHREDGPAVEWCDGSKAWYINGRCHREDGPAIELPSGDKQYFLNDKEYSEKDYWAVIRLGVFV